MNQRYAASGQWQKIIQDHIGGEGSWDLSEFKASNINYRIALHDVRTNGVRYLKTLTYHLATQLPEESWERLRRVPRREVGNPISVTYHGESVDLDYLRAVAEVEYLARHLRLDGGRVLEIGAGYGRTCHTLLSLHDVREYWVVDLPETMELARRYLQAVLDEDRLARLRFVPVDEVDDALRGAEFDLALNIDSFAEMDASTVNSYLSLIDRTSRHCYVNNPVGKYRDKDLDGHGWGEEAVALALRSGLLREVIDVYDSQAVEGQVPAFLSAYRPGDAWTSVADGWVGPWAYYWQALYRREPAAP